MSKNTETQQFESMMKDVEGIIQRISSGEAPLDELVENVEQGYNLIKKMRKKLDTVQDKVEKLRSDFELEEED